MVEALIELTIANEKVSANEYPLVIAHIGINHSGDLNIAKKMADLAAAAGCECLKHQTHFIQDEMTEEAKTIFPPNADLAIWEIMEKCALTPEEEEEFKSYSEALGMIWISTLFSRKATDFLDSIDVPAFKIGSGKCDNLPLIRHIASKGKPVIMSTGTRSIDSIKKSVRILEEANIDFALLECTNLYPSPPEIVSLRGVTELKAAFPKAVIGFSDHSIGPEMALSSVAHRAVILERHFTDTKYRKGPDIACSMDTAELAFLIQKSKEIHTSAANAKMRTTPEEAVYKFA